MSIVDKKELTGFIGDIFSEGIGIFDTREAYEEAEHDLRHGGFEPVRERLKHYESYHNLQNIILDYYGQKVKITFEKIEE